MADYSNAKVLDWWYDKEVNEYIAIMETVDHQWRCLSTSKHQDPKEGN